MRLNDEADEGKVSKEAFVAGILKYELLRRPADQGLLPPGLSALGREEEAADRSDALVLRLVGHARERVEELSPTSRPIPGGPTPGRTTGPRSIATGVAAKFDKARKLLEQMQAEEGYEEDQADVSYWIGRCLVRLDKPAEAVAAFSEAIRLDPDNAAAYRARGEHYEKLGEKAKAEADSRQGEGIGGG